LRKSFPQTDVAAAVGAAPIRWELVTGGGYGTNSAHWRVELDDDRCAFVKVALDDASANWLRDEHRIYTGVSGAFMPDLLGWHDDDATLLAIEDLSSARWPPPWRSGDVETVLATLELVAATPPAAGLPKLDDLREWLNGWELVAADPEPFLSTGLASREWLDGALPRLREAAAECELSGDALLHLDVRSDNLCLRGGAAVLVDWNLARVGNPLVDIVTWLPSLRLEGGPEPWELVPDSRGIAALIVGFFAGRAGLPPPPTAPTVREFQLRQAEVALPWAARELGLSFPR
jgi:Phosphotransferase enzyme family